MKILPLFNQYKKSLIKLIRKKNKILTICIFITLNFAHSQSNITDVSRGMLNEIEYFAEDSIIYDLEKEIVFLYNNAKVTSKNIELTAGFIYIDFIKNIIYARGMKDSLDTYVQSPILKEDNQSYEANTITYNYISKKAKIKKIITEESGGYLHGETIKKNNDNTYYLQNGKYTTCSLEEPHFYINAKKLKLITNDKIITGPANLVISDLQTPLFIPFGIFPISNQRSSGVILPSYGESASLGYNLKGLGYHFSINDHLNLTINSDIYTKGSWRMGLNSKYSKRYKFNGDININIAKTKIGEIERSDYSLSKDFKITWQHRQDAKAHPNSQLSALINIATSSYLQNNSYNSEYLNNTLASNISYYRKWDNKPYNMSINMRHNQNTITKQVNLTLPELSFSINRQFPFKNIIKKTWYKNLGISYNLNTKNTLSGPDSLILKDISQNIKSGVKHTIPISTSFNILKHLNINPSINYNERWYFKKTINSWNEPMQILDTDTTQGFWAIRDFNISTRLSTKIYGFFNIKNLKFRHVLTPSISYSYKPDFSQEKHNIYYNVSTNNSTEQFSYFNGEIYGIPSASRQSLLNINIANNLEMKSSNTEDEEKKIKLIDNLSISTSYNNALDSLKWSNIYFNIRTRLFNNIDLRSNTTIDPYRLENGLKINQLLWSHGKIGRVTSSSLDLNFQLNNTKRKKENTINGENEIYDINNNIINVVDFDIPWSLNVFYKLNYTKPYLEKEITQSVNFNGDVNITNQWKVGFRSGYDLTNKSFTYTSIDIYRDLHCWEMIFNWIPIGFHQSYNLMIRVKSSILQDLKLTKKKDFYDY